MKCPWFCQKKTHQMSEKKYYDELSHKINDKYKLDENKNNIFDSRYEEEDVDSNKTNSNNEEELQKRQHKNEKNNIKKKKEKGKRKRKYKESNESSEEDEQKEEKEDEKSEKLIGKNENNKISDRDDEEDKIDEKNVDVKEQLLKSIEINDNITRENILLADEINYKSSPSSIIQTDEFGYIIKKDEKNKHKNDNNQSKRTLKLLQINARMEKWNYMINNYDEFYNKRFKKLKSRTRKGIPDCFRNYLPNITNFTKKIHLKN